MEISTQVLGRVMVMTLRGRLDAVGAKDLQSALDAKLGPEIVFVVFEFSAVNYLSSAGIRVLLIVHKKLKERKGGFALCGLADYCREVLNMSGLLTSLPVFDQLEQAIECGRGVVKDREPLERWDDLEQLRFPCGLLRMIPRAQVYPEALVVGRVRDVLGASITPEMIRSRNFSETEYSIGLGGLGENTDDYFRIMGEMITIGGTMVWLPTDGHDTPDFLIPRTDSQTVKIRTAFNVSISGGFNEAVMFEASIPGGATVSDLYRALFIQAKKRVRDFAGAIAIAGWAQMPAVYGSGVKISPVAEFAPENRHLITDYTNLNQWFDTDEEPRHANVTALFCGIGVDLSCNLSGYDKEQLEAVFYTHPSNVGNKSMLLHNHGVFFNHMHMPDRLSNPDAAVKYVVEKGEFIDMRHLLDKCTIDRAFFGVSYIRDFRPEVLPDEAGAETAQKEKDEAEQRNLQSRRTAADLKYRLLLDQVLKQR